jgi:hypothetical protein
MKHTRPLLLAVSTLALLISACSQTDDLTAPTLEPQFGTRNYDSVEDVAYGKAGYLYAVGFWDSGYDPREFNGYHDVYQFSEKEVDAYLRRYDRSGNLVWENFFDIEPTYSSDSHRHQLAARAVAVDASGNAIVAWSADYLEYTYDDHYGYSYYERVASFNYLSKYSPSGKRLWRVYTNNKRIRDLALDSSGNVYAISQGALTKYSSSGAQAWERVSNVTPTGVAVSSTNNIYVVRENGAVIKYNSGGTQLYAKTSSLDGYNYYGYKIAAGLNDELYITGAYLYDTVTNDSCDASGSTYKYYARLYKLSSTGTRQWFKNAASMSYRYNLCDYFYGWAPGYGLNVAADNLGNAYVATGASNLDAIVTKHSRSGSLLWSKGFGSGAPLDGATSVATYDGSEVFVGAVTYGGLAHRRLGGSDAVLREMNSSGAQVWTR